MTNTDIDLPVIDLASVIIMTADAHGITDLHAVNEALGSCWFAQLGGSDLVREVDAGVDRFGPIFRAWIEMIFFACGSQVEFDEMQEEIIRPTD